MTKGKLGRLTRILEVEDIKKGRFSFVKNDILRENVSIKMQHIAFLSSPEEEYDLPGALAFSCFKTIIVFTASIIEALIHYKLDELIKKGGQKTKGAMGKEEKYTDCKELYRISESETICGIKKTTVPKKLSAETNFIELNRAAKRIGLFTDELFKKAEKIRIARNKIHAYSLKEIDDKYTKNEINAFFAIASQIIEQIKKS